MLQQAVTIKDIARELNISVSTISRALRDTFDVSSETKHLVLEKAKELNYKPIFKHVGYCREEPIILVLSYPLSPIITFQQSSLAFKKSHTI